MDPIKLIKSWDVVNIGLVNLYSGVHGRRQTPILKLRKESDQLCINIDPRPFGYDKSLELINNYYEAIGNNLNERGLQPSCILPIFVFTANNNSNITVALFGKEDFEGNIVTVAWMKWIAFDNITKSCTTMNENRISRCFITKRNNETFQHFKNNIYVNVDLPNMSMMFCIKSQIDNTIEITEDMWCVTFVVSTSGGAARTGHAMLACEGFTDEGPFLKYLHITAVIGGLPSVAKAEIKEKSSPLDTQNGPTWKRSKELVLNMIAVVQRSIDEDENIMFSVYLNAVADTGLCYQSFCGPFVKIGFVATSLYHFCGLAALCCYSVAAACNATSCCSDIYCRSCRLNETGYRTIGEQQDLHIAGRLDGAGYLTCLRWVVKVSSYAGIFFYVHNNMTTPLQFVESINKMNEINGIQPTTVENDQNSVEEILVRYKASTQEARMYLLCCCFHRYWNDRNYGREVSNIIYKDVVLIYGSENDVENYRRLRRQHIFYWLIGRAYGCSCCIPFV